MKPLVLITASMLASDLNHDARVDGRDIAVVLATWDSSTSPATLANVLANAGADWSDRTLFFDGVQGVTWGAANDVDRRIVDSPFPGFDRLEVFDREATYWTGDTREHWFGIEGTFMEATP